MQLLPPLLLLFTLFNAAVYGFEAVNHARTLDLTIESTIVVDKSGGGNFQTVQAAIDSVPPFIYLEGADRTNTFITFNDHQQTDISATFTSYPSNIIARGITFENSFNLAAALQLFVPNQGTFVTQALAARIYGDKSAFFSCGFKGFQDTLWDVQGRHFFQNCYIEGAIDFIFGNGQSVYKVLSSSSFSANFKCRYPSSSFKRTARPERGLLRAPPKLHRKGRKPIRRDNEAS